MSRRRRRTPTVAPAAELEDTGVRQVIYEAFRQLGGVTGLVKWGRANPASFYRLFASCGPRFSPQAPGRRVRAGTPGAVAAVTDFTRDDADPHT